MGVGVSMSRRDRTVVRRAGTPNEVNVDKEVRYLWVSRRQPLHSEGFGRLREEQLLAATRGQIVARTRRAVTPPYRSDHDSQNDEGPRGVPETFVNSHTRRFSP